MPNVITDRDVRDYVIRALDGREAGFDVGGIVGQIMAEYGPFDVADTLDGAIDTDAFWGIVAAYDLADEADQHGRKAAELRKAGHIVLDPQEARELRQFVRTLRDQNPWDIRAMFEKITGIDPLHPDR